MNKAEELNQLMFTPAAVLDLLCNIDELSNLDISMTETFDDKIQIQVGESYYQIDSEDAQTIRVEDEVVGELEVVTEEAYKEIMDEGDYEYSDEEAVEGGIIKSAVKSLLLGGMIRFANKHLMN